MALRKIVLRGDEILTKVCKPVKEITPRIVETMNDMVETMEENYGVGLAAPQIGVMKRYFVARPYPDAEDEEMDQIYYMINPEITEREGSQESCEGCLSYPGYVGYVNRPTRIKMKAQDLDGKWHEYEFEDFAAIVMSHEYDHLDGILYTDKARDIMTNEEHDALMAELEKEENEAEDSEN